MGEKMKRVISLMGWVSVFVTILALIFTWLTTYQFTYRLQNYFNNYYVLQICLLVTMFLWGLKFLTIKENARNLLYTIMCTIIAACTIFFMYMRVY